MWFLTGAATGNRSAAETYPIWDARNQDEQTHLRHTLLYEKVKSKCYGDFVLDARLDNLWPKFKRYNVVNKATEQRIKVPNSI